MRIRLTLRNPTSATPITWNYNYLVMAWVYDRLKLADKEYANFLHQKGYQANENTKRFKYFTFSPFHFNPGKGQYSFNTNGLTIKGESFYIDLSFYVEKAAESFITGVFKNQQLSIFNNRQRAEFQISQISTLPEPSFTNSMTFKAWAPINVALKQEVGQDIYLRPDQADFADLLKLNLADKYNNATGTQINLNEIKYKLLTDPKAIKARTIKIKENSKKETQIKGYYNFEFKLEAPPEVLKCGYNSGFGKYNGEGLGMVEVT